MKISRYLVISLGLACLLLWNNLAFAQVNTRGIYLTQYTLQNTKTINHLIEQSKKTGVNTFVIDFEKMTPMYKKNIELVKAAGIQYVARVVVFPDGGVTSAIRSPTYWENRYKLMQQAISLGASAIQLDYIRYKASQPASPQNVADITKVITWYKTRLAAQNIPMQVDVFGETSIKPSMHIGQDVKALASQIDVLCPMVYPSHYAPWEVYTKKPYETVYNSLTALNKQFDNKPPFKVNAFIEVRNFRASAAYPQRVAYLQAQIKAVQDAKVNGWYAWSANNKYDLLFKTLAQTPSAQHSGLAKTQLSLPNPLAATVPANS